MMKNITCLLILVLSISSCKQNDDFVIETNDFMHTSWTADDLAANQVYGDGCTTTIEFLSINRCQEINSIASGPFEGTIVKPGFYKVTTDSITWTLSDGSSKAVHISGGVLVSKTSVNGNRITYIKD